MVTGTTTIYDGEEHGLASVIAVKEGSTILYSIDGQNFDTTEPKFVAADKYEVFVKATNPTCDDTPVVSAYVTINKRPITIKAESASKYYDGTALTNEAAAISEGTLGRGSTLKSVTVTGSQTEVGSSENVPSNAVITVDGVDVTDNYAITYQNGTLVVSRRSSGGGPSGGGGPSTGSTSAKPETGGPGALTTINQDEVPLAIMPDLTSADLTVIDDGEVPFAALPKTGQSSVKGTLTMMMSGILLALVAINKKRKEEDNS